MKKENGRLKPADPMEKAHDIGKPYACTSCGFKFRKTDVVFGAVVHCPLCSNIADEVEI
jgi:hypothetical protein